MRHFAFFAVVTAVGFLGGRAVAAGPAATPSAGTKVAANSPAKAGANTAATAGKFFKAHCVECHGPDTQEGGLRLDSLSVDFSAPASFALGVKIHDRLRNGEMPPKDSPQPTPNDRRAMVQWLAAGLVESDTAHRRAEGRGVMRRLNRTEYEHTLRDLFNMPGVPVRDMLPDDGYAYGYDKSGDGLELSHVQMAKYMEAADFVLDAATATQVDRPSVVNRRVYPTEHGGFGTQVAKNKVVLLKDFKADESIIEVADKKVKGKESKEIRKGAKKSLEDFEGAVGIFDDEGAEFHPSYHGFSAPNAGMYRLRLSFWSFTWFKTELLNATNRHVVSIRVGPKAYERVIGYYDVQSLKPTVQELVVWLNPGDHVGFNAVTLRHASTTGKHGRAEWTGEGVATDWLEVEGPLLDGWPTSGHRRLFGELPLQYMGFDSPLRAPDHAPPFGLGKTRRGGNIPNAVRKLGPWTVVSKQPKADAQRLLGDFLPLAFRRPVSAAEIARYVGIVENLLATSDLTFEDSLRWAYKTALCSPEFLFLSSPPGKLNDWNLASRLSYFLWNSMPDAQLMSLAAQGKLTDSAVLRAQVDRMLVDPKSKRFVDDFIDQWLDLQDIADTIPDKKLYPEFNNYLRDAMVGETRAFFREMLDQNLSVTNFVDSDFSMLNQPIAEHYGIPGVQGVTFRKVALPPGCHRGGVLTQASVMKVTANGTTTTPVKRGAWVMRELLGQPPDPPPPNIPAVEPDVSGATTIREQLAKHRSSQVCASCHAKIDPPGFALENFDVIGGWRTWYRSLGDGERFKTADGRHVPYVQGPAVDPAGELKDGRKFTDIDELRRLLLSDPDRLARNVATQLLVYATGSEIGFADRQVVDDILAKTRPSHHGLQSLIHEVVQSRLFREK